MIDPSPKYERGKHPNSLDNLNQSGACAVMVLELQENVTSS
jgi:hypothetical protein